MVIRVFISPTRSGSTALLRCFENNPSVERVYHQPVKSGFRTDGVFDYSFYEEFFDDDSLRVAKETVGGFERPETAFEPLPSGANRSPILPPTDEIIRRLKPLVLLRDPLQTWASIERLNRFSAGKSPYHSPFEYFVASYVTVIDFIRECRPVGLPVHVITIEMLAADPKRYFQRICADWEIPWTPAMIDWTLPYGDKTWFSDEAQYRMEHDARFRKSKETLEASSAFGYAPSALDVVNRTEHEVITVELRPLYLWASQLAQQDFGS